MENFSFLNALGSGSGTPDYAAQLFPLTAASVAPANQTNNYMPGEWDWMKNIDFLKPSGLQNLDMSKFLTQAPGALPAASGGVRLGGATGREMLGSTIQRQAIPLPSISSKGYGNGL